jgi:pantoate kinase
MPWCASVPHHITSIFYPVYTSTLLTTGSIGVGLAVEPRFKVCTQGVSPPPTSTAARALRLLGSSEELFTFETPLPPAKGYAVSASSAIGVSLVTTRTGGGKVSVMEALNAAHKAEVLERTGLGDVLALSCGIGVVLRLQAGAPGVGKVDCLTVPRSVTVFSLEAANSMSTRLLLDENYVRRASEIALPRLRKVFEGRSFEVFVGESQRYTDELHLLERVVGGRNVSLVRATPGLIGYYAKKLVAVVFVDSDRALDARDHLLGIKGITLRLLQASEKGFHVWWDYGT